MLFLYLSENSKKKKKEKEKKRDLTQAELKRSNFKGCDPKTSKFYRH